MAEKRRRAAGAAIALVIRPSPAACAAAQSLRDIAAYAALAATPTAGVAPIARPWMSIASGRGDVGISAGYFTPSCDGASGGGVSESGAGFSWPRRWGRDAKR